MKALLDIVAKHRSGKAVGIPSICSAHPVVLDAALIHARESGRPVLIEATSNQVNQFGGYTGMRPADFHAFVMRKADQAGLAREQVLLGGDHLGPNCWQDEPAASAMAKADTLIDDRYIRAAFKAEGLDYDAQLKNYAKLPLKATDALTGAAITDEKGVVQVWVTGEPKVRSYACAQNAFADVKRIEAAGRKVRVVYAQDRELGLKLLANQAWFAADARGQLSAFLLKDDAAHWAQTHQTKLLDFAAARELATAHLASAQ